MYRNNIQNCYFDIKDHEACMACGGDMTAPTSPVATIYGWQFIFITLVCECRDRLWDMITIQQQTCYCDMLMLNSYIFCYISKPILKWHIIMLTLQNYVIFNMFTICQYNILCHFNIPIFTVMWNIALYFIYTDSGQIWLWE